MSLGARYVIFDMHVWGNSSCSCELCPVFECARSFTYSQAYRTLNPALQPTVGGEYPVDAIPSRPSSGVVAAPGRHKTMTCLHLCIFSRIATLKVKA